MKFKVGDKVKIPVRKTAGNIPLTVMLDMVDLSKSYLTIAHILNTFTNGWIEIRFSEDISKRDFIFHENDLELYEEKQNNMKTKQTIINIEIGKKLYQSDDPALKEWALLNFSKEELEAKELPKSWEELQSVEGYFVNSSSRILQGGNKKNDYTITSDFKNTFPTKSLAEGALALSQLLQLRNAWWNGYDPYDSKNIVLSKDYIAFNHQDKELKLGNAYTTNRIFVFQTGELAQEFLDTFKDLLWTAKEYL